MKRVIIYDILNHLKSLELRSWAKELKNCESQVVIRKTKRQLKSRVIEIHGANSNVDLLIALFKGDPNLDFFKTQYYEH